MKRLIPLIVVLLILPSLFINVRAEENRILDIYEGLPEDVADKLPEGFESSVKENGANAVKDLDASFILSFISKTLVLSCRDIAPMLVALIGAVIISAILSSFSHGNEGGTGTALDFSSSVAITVICIGVIMPLWEEVGDALSAIGIIIKSSLPILTAIAGASGQISSSAVNAVWLNALLTLTDELAQSILSPLVSVCIAFIAVSAISRSGSSSYDMSGILSSVKKIFIFFLTLFSTVLTVIMAFQSVVAKGSDTVLLRSVKFASGSAIPVIGGALSEAAGAYVSSIGAIKGAAGTLTAVSVILSILPVFLKLFAVKLGFVLSSFISEMIGCKGSFIIKEFSSLIDLLTALLAICSTVFIIALGVFASSLPSI